MVRTFFFWSSILAPLCFIIWVVVFGFIPFFYIRTISNEDFLLIDEVVRVLLFLVIVISSIYQVSFILRSDDRELAEKRRLWISLIFFGNMFVIPVFSFIYLRAPGHNNH